MATKGDEKEELLKNARCLNPHPERVRSKIFHTGLFFDPRDLVQVKYEMLREVDREGTSVSQAATDYGMSRPSFYQAKADFESGGIPALSGQKRGPRRAHKVNEEIYAFIEAESGKSQNFDSAALSDSILKQFKVKIHPRTIERAVKRKKKQTTQADATI